ncbi:MAG: TPM domain-containing protein [Bacteroidales bacterium]|nr:TPM domain-containing protein [Bacteroidales bacterium]
MKASDFFTEIEKKRIQEAIRKAEERTSGEIRVHVELSCKKQDVKDCAAAAFARLGMHKTKLRNGVLIYLSIEDHRFAILGDAGINALVPPNFWDEIVDLMKDYFKQQLFVEGLVEGINKIGVKLKEFFPVMSDDVNELNNEISFGK